MLNNYSDKIFFYCYPTGSPENAAYQAAIVCLAEGLEELGIPFYSNINHWRTSPDKDEYLFRHDPAIKPDDCTIVVFDGCWFTFGNSFPENLFHPKRTYTTVYFEQAADGKHGWKPEFKQFDFIFRAHYNKNFQYPSNFHPWAFGLSRRIIQETAEVPDFEDRKKSLLVNFRIGHPLRHFVQENFIPHISKTLTVDDSVDSFDSAPSEQYHYLQWKQTGMRHYPEYYKRLRESVACACFGGLFINPWPRNAFGPTNSTDRIFNKLLKALHLKPSRLMNWESSRFWESLAAGCVTLHVDLEKYGAFLPIMPENWRHYIGIDLENIEETIFHIANEPDVFEKISVEGRRWALEHYSPVPTTLRFLETIYKRRKYAKLS
jgi:hypothetical protein